MRSLYDPYAANALCRLALFGPATCKEVAPKGQGPIATAEAFDGLIADRLIEETKEHREGWPVCRITAAGMEVLDPLQDLIDAMGRARKGEVSP
jgi:hypothetical protein